MTLRKGLLAAFESEAIKKDEKPDWLINLNNTCQKLVKYCPEIKLIFSNLNVDPKTVQNKIKVLSKL